MQDAQNRDALKIYLRCVEEAKHRLAIAERFASGVLGHVRVDTESACLQLRKAFELVAYAAIAPHKTKYQTWRGQVKKNKDFRRDFNGRKILQSLSKINQYSYPRPLMPPVFRDGAWHYELYTGEYLTKKRYGKIYDTCGKLLHADNPWGNDKPYEQFLKKVPECVGLTRALLNIHSIIIQHESGIAAWVVELGDSETKAKGHIGHGDVGLDVSEDYYS